MQERNLWLAVCGVLLFVCRPGWCDESVAANPSDQDLRRWVVQLNDDDYAVREEAAAKLTAAGVAAIEALVEGVASDEAEVAWRCGAALEHIGLEGNERTIDQIVKHLDAACARTGRQGLKSLAADLHARQKQFRRSRAIAQIRKHGGQISGPGIDGGIEEGFVAPFAAPAIIFDGPIVAMEPVAVAGPVELPRADVFDLFEEIGKAIAEAVAPADAKPAAKAPPPADLKIEAAAVDDPKPEEEKPAAEKPAEEKPMDEPAPAVEGSEPAPVAEVEVAAVAEIAFADAMVVGGFAGGMAIDGMGMDGGWAQLSLGPNWRGGDDGLAVLADLPELTQIDLRQTRLTDKTLPHLAKLPGLRQLNIYHAGFSRDALLKFHRQRPTVVIYARGDAMMGVNADFSSSPLVLSSIYGGSGASDAGLAAGDVIHTIDNIKIRDFSDLTICVSTKKPGDTIQVVYERDGKKQTVRIKLKPRAVDE